VEEDGYGSYDRDEAVIGEHTGLRDEVMKLRRGMQGEKSQEIGVVELHAARVICGLGRCHSRRYISDEVRHLTFISSLIDLPCECRIQAA
jgi:hypothetical protein